MADKVSLATLALAKAYTDEHGGGGGGTSNYNDLTHKPTVNGVEFKGTMTGETLGLVDAEDGKGLSTNDYTDADKAIVDGVTSALALKVDKVDGKSLSDNNYSDTDKAIVDGVTTALNGKVSKSETAGLLKNDGTVDTEKKANLSDIAPTFSTSVNYKAYQLVVYNGELYRFKKNHNAGAWISDDVQTAKVEDVLKTKQPKTWFDSTNFVIASSSVGDSETVTLNVANQVVSGVANVVTSGAVYTAVSAKEDRLNWDTTPTQNSNNPVTSGGVYTALQDKVDWSSYARTGVHNLLFASIDYMISKNVSGTWNGYTYSRGGVSYACTVENGYVTKITVNTDQNGATADSELAFIYDDSNYFKGDDISYILNGCPSGGANDTYNIIYRIGKASDHSYISLKRDTGEGTEVRGISNTEDLRIEIIIKSGTVMTNKEFYPMVRLASDTNSNFAPPAMTNKELTYSKFPRDEQAVLGAKNLLKNTATTQTINNVAFTVNSDDKTVNVTRTAEQTEIATKDLYVVSDEDYKLLAGKTLLMTGCPSGGSNDTYYLECYYNDGTGHWLRDIGDGLTIAFPATKPTTIKFLIGIKVASVIPSGGLTFKPMLRLASDPDDTYVPYAMTNRELTVGKFDKKIKYLNNTYSLDDIKETGLYYYGSSRPTNAPEDKNYCLLEVFNYDNDYTVYQRVTRTAVSEAVVYTRSFTDNTWKPWFKYSGTVVS